MKKEPVGRGMKFWKRDGDAGCTKMVLLGT